MKKEEIREMTTSDLTERLEQMQKDYKVLVANHAVTPVDNTAKIKADRRDIARVKTELRRRELNNK